MKFHFKHTFLISKLQSDQEHIATWAAFHLLKYYPALLADDLDYFLDSPYKIIKEAGILKAISLFKGTYLNKVYKTFREADGNLKNLAGFYLSLQPNDLTKQVITEWFEEQLCRTGYTYESLFYSCLAFVELDKKKNLNILFDKLQLVKNDIVKSEIFFKVLVDKCNTKTQFKQLLQFYFFSRKNYPETFTFDKLLEVFHAKEITENIIDIKNKKYSVYHLYQEIYDKISLDFPDDISAKKIKKFGSIFQLVSNITNLKQKEIDEIITTFYSWLKGASSQKEIIISKKIFWMVEFFKDHCDKFFNTVPKLQKKEIAFILISKGITDIEKEVQSWTMSYPKKNNAIKNYLQNNFISYHNQELLINEYFQDTPKWKDQDLIIKNKKVIQLHDSKNKIIFDFLNQQYKNQNVLWYKYFNIEVDNFSFLFDALQHFYKTNFVFYVENQFYRSIQFALQLLIKKFNKELLKLVIQECNYIIEHHHTLLLQIIYLYPDQEFFTILKSKYKTGEEEITKLLKFLSSIHDLKLNKKITNDIAKIDNLIPNHLRMRLKCNHCSEKNHYAISNICINSDAVHHTMHLNNEDIWIAKKIHCHSCKQEIQVCFEDYELEDLRKNALVIIKTQIGSLMNSVSISSYVSFLSFPRLNNQSYNPNAFFQKIEEYKKANTKESIDKANIMRLQLSHFYENLNLWEENIRLLSHDIPSHFKIQFLTQIGISWYKISHWIQSEKYLKQACKHAKSIIPNYEEARYLKQAEKVLTETQNPLKNRAFLKLVENNS